MKRSRVVALTLAGISLSLTGCNRRNSPPNDIHGNAIIPPSSLSPDMQSALPAFTPGQDVSAQNPPLNAYDPKLGYYHLPCTAWFPYPYDHYDSRWGYYRCGRWSRDRNTHYSSTRYLGGRSSIINRPSGATPDPATPIPTNTPDGSAAAQYAAPMHAGIPHSEASTTRRNSVNRGGFGSTGRSSLSSGS